MTVYERITKLAEEMSDEVIATRRDFHKYPETGWVEMRTSSIIARKLTEMGMDEVLVGDQVCNREARMAVPAEEDLEKNYQRAMEQGGDPEFLPYMKDGMTGVIGIMHCGEGPTVALRFDIDALNITEDGAPTHRPQAEGFASVNPGMAHACGHDAHAAIGLGVARTLMEIRDQLHGTIKLIFQPAEEGVRGAKAVVDAGHLDGVNYCIGSHVAEARTDEMGAGADMSPGSYGSLATAKYDVYFHGVSAHAGGSPEKGKNVMLAVATAIMNLYAIPRHSGGATRINVGTVTAGSGRNVIADVAKMELEFRGATTELCDYVENYALPVLEASASMHGCTCRLERMGAAPSMVSDDAMTEIVRCAAGNVGLKVSKDNKLRHAASEDFSFMVNRVQEQGGIATFMRMHSKYVAPEHNRSFDVEEHMIPNAVRAFCATVYEIMK